MLVNLQVDYTSGGMSQAVTVLQKSEWKIGLILTLELGTRIKYLKQLLPGEKIYVEFKVDPKI